MEEYGVARGFIELDITNMKSSIASAVNELNKIDRAGDLAQSELNKLQAVSMGVGGAFQQATDKSRLLSLQLNSAKEKSAIYKQEIANLNTMIEKSKNEQHSLNGKIKDSSTNFADAEKKAEVYGQGVESLQKSLKELSKDHRSVETALKQTERAMMQAEVGGKKNQEQIERLSSSMKTLGGREEKLSSQIANKSDKLEAAKQQYGENSSQVKKLQGELGTLTIRQQSLTAKLGETKTKLETVKVSYTEYAAQAQRMSAVLLNLRQKEQDLAGKIAITTERLQSAKTKYGENSVEALKYETALEEMKLQHQQLGIQIDRSVDAVKEFEMKLNNTDASISHMSKELAEAQSKTAVFGSSMQSVGGKIQTLGGGINNIGSKLTMGITMPLAATGAYAVKTAIDFESAFTGVTKTVDGTAVEIDKLRQGIIRMSKEIPANTTELSAVAEAAGQLGIQTPNILGFTRVMTDLGNTTNLSAEEGANALARFANVTGMSQDKFSNLGSAVVDLGNRFSTSEREIVSMGSRLVGAGHQVGMTEPQILGFATALSSVGIEAEAGGTAFSTLMSNMQLAVEQGGDGLHQFAEVAGMSAEQFQTAFRDDAAGAILSFVKGLSTCEERGLSAISVLDEMGLSDVRMRDALLRAAGASNMFSSAIDVGTKAWDANVALTNEAKQKYETTGSQIEISKNRIADSARIIGEKMTPAVADLVEGAADLAEKFGELDPKTQKVILGILAGAAATGPLLAALGTTTSGIGALTKGVGKLLETAGKKAALKAVESGIKGVGSTAATSAASVGGMSKVIRGLTSPLGMATLAIGGMAVALKMSNDQSDARIAKIAALSNKEKELSDRINLQSTSYQGLRSARKETISGIDNEFARTQSLVNELNGLADETGYITDGNRERAQVIANELSHAYGMEIEIVDGTIKKYDELCTSIDQVMQIKHAEAVQNAMRPEYDAAIRNETLAFTDYAQAQKDVAETSKELRDAQGKLDEVNRMFNHGVGLTEQGLTVYQDALKKSNESVSGLEKRLKKQNGTLKQSEETYIGYQATIANFEGVTAAVVSGDTERIKQSIQNLTNEFVTAEIGTRDTLKNQVTNLEQTYKEMQEAVNAGAPGITQESVDAMKTLVEQSKAELVKSVEAAKPQIIESMKSYGLSASDGLVQSLAEKSPEVRSQAICLLAELQHADNIKRGEILDQLNSLGIQADASLSSGLDHNKGSVRDSSTNVIDTIDTATGARIGQITPWFSTRLGGMAASGVGAMEGITSSSNLSAPNMHTPDWSEIARTAWEGMQSWLDDHSLSVAVNMVKKAGSAIGDFFGFAYGGIATEPAIFGEDGAEMAIPLDPMKRSRALGLYEQTGKILGVTAQESTMRTHMIHSVSAMNHIQGAERIYDFNMQAQQINYKALAKAIAEELRHVPIACNPTIEMSDGDVYIGLEKAGKVLAPVISRIMTRSL